MTFAQVCEFHEVLVRVYEEAGYRVREIGKGSVDERLERVALLMNAA